MRRMTALLALLVGCSGLEPEPLDPARSEAEFRARRLEDPNVLAYLESQGIPKRAAWQLDALTFAAFYYHPDLDIARARLLGARGAERTAGTVPNPTLNGDLEKVLGSPEGGVSPWVYGVNLQMPLDFLWKRGYRVDEARARIAASRFELGEVAWQVRRRVRAALLDEVLARREVELRQKEFDVRTNLAAVAELLAVGGETSRLEADRALADRHVAVIALEEAKGRAKSTRAALASAIGVSSAALEGVAIEWPKLDQLPGVAPPELQELGLLNRLDVRRGLAEYAAAEAALGLELMKRYPDVTLGPGYLFDQGDKKFTLGLSISLPIFNQNGGPIAEAEAKRKEAAARFLSIQARAIGEFEEATARYRAGRLQVEIFRNALDVAGARLEKIQRAVELGESDRATLLGARIERSIVEFAAFEALRRTQEALGGLEDALQRPLEDTPRAPEIPETVPRRGGPGKEKP